MAGAFSSAFSSAFDVGAGASVGSLWWYSLGLGEFQVFKNVASQKVTLLVIDTAANTPKTGDAANLTAYVSKDDGAVTALTDTSASELDATNAPGLYSFDLTQAESNADKLLFSAKSSTSGIRVVPLLVYTRANNINDLVIDASGNLTAGITGNITGNLSGSVGSVSGAVGSVTGAVGSVTGNVGGNVSGSVGSVTGNVGGNVTGSVGSLATQAKADVQAEAEEALQTYHLDHLIQSADPGGVVADSSFLAKLASKSATPSFASYSNQTDSLEAIRDRGDAAWTTATGFSTHSAADVWAVATRVLTAGTNINGSTFTSIPWNAAWDAEVQSEVQDAIEVNHLDHLLAATYDPASKPGAADALLNELVGDDGGVSQFTANALELAPTGGSAPTAVQIRQEIDSNSTQLAAIVADTNELQTDWANGGRLDLLIDAILADTGTDGVAISATTANQIADALLDRTAGVETNRTPRQALRLVLAALVGKLSGAATTTVTIRDTNDGVNRVVATVDADGNRSAVTLDAS